MSSRRAFLCGAAACLLAPSAKAAEPDLYLPPPGVSSRNDLYLPGSAPPGLPASPAFLDEVDALHKVEEGKGLPRIRILFEFGCPRSPELYRRIRPMLGKARFDWIPIPDVKAPSNSPAAALFADGASAATLRDVFAGKPADKSDPASAGRQSAAFVRRVGPDLYRETNRPFATPTLIYQGRDAETRIIRGAPDIGTLRAIVASAI